MSKPELSRTKTLAAQRLQSNLIPVCPNLFSNGSFLKTVIFLHYAHTPFTEFPITFTFIDQSHFALEAASREMENPI
jgi:hypothetical protein